MRMRWYREPTCDAVQVFQVGMRGTMCKRMGLQKECSEQFASKHAGVRQHRCQVLTSSLLRYEQVRINMQNGTLQFVRMTR